MVEKYDIVIIGSGIGGLVCGCYLAKFGYKVLILEKHTTIGGYCGSFSRKNFVFDIGVHYLGSLRKEGVLYNILNELSVYDRLKTLRSEICDRIIIPKKTINIFSEKLHTKEELIKNFYKEKDSIINFFNFINKTDLLKLASKTIRINFYQLLSSFFYDKQLKSIMSIPLINIGLPPKKASALIASILFKEYIFDPGYYPYSGIQKFPELLAQRFKELGGILSTSNAAEKLTISNNNVIAIQTSNNIYYSKFVVSNIDPTYLFK